MQAERIGGKGGRAPGGSRWAVGGKMAVREMDEWRSWMAVLLVRGGGTIEVAGVPWERNLMGGGEVVAARG